MSSSNEIDTGGASRPIDKSKQLIKFAKRMAFAKFVASKANNEGSWECCGQKFGNRKEIHCHAARHHKVETNAMSAGLQQHGHPDAKWKLLKSQVDATAKITQGETGELPTVFLDSHVYSWLPSYEASAADDDNDGQVLLFYIYRSIPSTNHLCSWQEALCKRLKLTGKVRTATEGINATVAGSYEATEVYMKAFLSHPWFQDMTRRDFKTSPGNQQVFPKGLVVGCYEEIVPMGISPSCLSHESTGEHLTPAQFHSAVEEHLQKQDQSDAVFVDCRNFYESRIGQFRGALAPDIRKFSYWPEYVDTNADLFDGKRVFMYCTGGIRCERGAAYVKAKTKCRDIYQLEGGIHKYIEQFPEGHYRGKLFVFDDRYAIKSNDDIIAVCNYCQGAWDSYAPCSSKHCHQLVLSCPSCRDCGLTACCQLCQHHADLGQSTEECTCTKLRKRIPVDTHAAREQTNELS